jgi:hypothetical protein
MEYLTKISPAIPVLRAVRHHLKWQIWLLLSRGTWHSSPAKEKDIQKWVDIVMNEQWLLNMAERTFKQSVNRAPDVMTEGSNNLFQNGVLGRWWNARSYVRSDGCRLDKVGRDKHYLKASMFIHPTKLPHTRTQQGITTLVDVSQYCANMGKAGIQLLMGCQIPMVWWVQTRRGV